MDSNSNIINTTDGGENWDINRDKEAEVLTCVFFIDANRGWAVGDSVLYTEDAGDSWSKLTKTTLKSTLSQVIFDKNGTGRAIGNDFNIYVSHNNGVSWAELSDKWKQGVADKVSRTKFRRD